MDSYKGMRKPLKITTWNPISKVFLPWNIEKNHIVEETKSNNNVFIGIIIRHK